MSSTEEKPLFQKGDAVVAWSWEHGFEQAAIVAGPWFIVKDDPTWTVVIERESEYVNPIIREVDLFPLVDTPDPDYARLRDEWTAVCHAERAIACLKEQNTRDVRALAQRLREGMVGK